MKLLYLGTGVDSLQEVIGREQLPDGSYRARSVELLGWEPPDIETPYWEFHFMGDISAYTDGRTLVVVQGEAKKEDKGGERVVRMRRVVQTPDKEE